MERVRARWGIVIASTVLLQSPHGDWRKRPGMALAARDKARPEHPSTSTSVSKLSSQPRILSCPSAPVHHCPQVGNSHGNQKESAQLTPSPGEENGGFQDPQHQQALFRGPLMAAQSPQRDQTENWAPASEARSWFSGIQDCEVLCSWINQSTAFSQHLHHKTGRGRVRLPNHDFANHSIPYEQVLLVKGLKERESR